MHQALALCTILFLYLVCLPFSLMRDTCCNIIYGSVPIVPYIVWLWERRSQLPAGSLFSTGLDSFASDAHTGWSKEMYLVLNLNCILINLPEYLIKVQCKNRQVGFEDIGCQDNY
ncbi:hypothetical protein HS088_TW09G01246 [Tripterygium wilfordii]|uniref:Uncharacterized protein n=1 Tax=Tripterygium wilfordii TaxID=458696 RepID=A0A7J7DA49_TRIWF|nr:hypothetical protein HS088_TW09G01246 [Tripterygium wilfordii]